MPTSIRGLTRVWRLPPPTPPGCAIPGVEPLVARVLVHRGLGDPDASRLFMAPSLKHLHEPSLIPDLDRAAERLLGALAAGEPIVIYGDYDVDGITATAILFHTLRAISPGGGAADVRTYVPHRIDEGYGLNEDAIAQLAAQGAKVIVSVDCGIGALGPALAARRAGIDLIITDHHNPPATVAELPEAYAIVHPRRPDSTYPFEHLCGAGVAYKLAWRLATMHAGAPRASESLRRLLIDLLPLVALGVIADVVPLVGENRVLARFGLERIKHSSLHGLRALVEACGLAGDDIDAEHAGFALAPRLNACGRLGHAREAVELFTTATPDQAAAIATRLSRLNEERRQIEKTTAAEAIQLAHEAGMTGADRRAIVLARAHWHPGVVGIVCSRLVERFGRPTILMQDKDGECHGSGRSIAGFSLHGALSRCSGFLTSYGGHDMAAGLRLPTDRLALFVDAFTAQANTGIEPDQMCPTVDVDCDATLEDLSLAAARQLEVLAPFGMGNPRPRVRLAGLQIAKAEPLGREGKHLSMHVRQGSRIMRLLAWNWGDRREQLPAGARIDALVSPKVSTWNGRTNVEPELTDVRLVESAEVRVVVREQPAVTP